MEFPELPKPYSSPQLISRHENRVVLRVWSEEIEEQVVLKCLLPPHDEPEADSFREEYLHLEALDHPNWVRPGRFGYFEDGGMWFSLELSKGVPLSEFPVQGWTPEVLEISRQVLSALNALHLRGVAQLDLKPEQILVSWEGEGSAGWAGENANGIGDRIKVHLLDLGLASEFGKNIGGAGTPGYMAPELLVGGTDWDGRADLYAFGCVLFELMTGAPLFGGTDGRQILRRQVQGVEVTERARECGYGVSATATEHSVPLLLVDLLERLVDSAPAARTRDAIDTWFRLRDVAGGDLTEAPLLDDSRRFPFCGREEEIGVFESWLERLEDEQTSAHYECLLRGEVGIGKRRLIHRLRSLAATRGWLVVGERLCRTDNDVSFEFGTEGAFSGMATADTVVTAQSLEIDVRPMSQQTLQKLVLATGSEQGALTDYLVECSFGSPHLLLGLTKSIPSELLIGAASFSRSEIWSFFETVPSPDLWSQWQRSFVTSLSEEGKSDLFRQCLRDVGISFKRIDKQPIANRELVLWRERLTPLPAEIPAGPPCLPRMWAHGFLKEFAKGQDRRVEEFIFNTSEPADCAAHELEASTRVLADFGVWPNPLLEAAVAWIGNSGQPGQIPVLFEEAVRGAQSLPDLSSLSGTTLTAVLYNKSMGLNLRWKNGALFPGKERALQSLDPVYRVLFSALDTRSEAAHEATVKLLEASPVPDGEKLAIVWSDVYAAALRQLRRSEELAEIWGMVLRSFSQPSQELLAWVQLSQSDLVNSRDARASLEDLSNRWSERQGPILGRTLLKLGHVQLRSGDSIAAEQSLDGARVEYERFGSEFAATTMDASSCAIRYANGDLRGAMQLSKAAFHRNLVGGSWFRALSSLFNWVLVASETGRFQDCLSFLRTGWRFRVKEIHPQQEAQLRVLEAIVRLRVGQSNRKNNLARPDQDTPRELAQLEICQAHVEYQIGNCESASGAFERALEYFIQNDQGEDRAEHVSYWLRLLCDSGDKIRSVAAYSAHGADCFSAANIGTRTLLTTIQCEMCLEGWLEGPADLDLVDQSLEAQKDLDEAGFAPHAWKLSWRLSSFFSRKNETDAAWEFRRDASNRLKELCEGFQRPADAEMFLQLPGPQRFLSSEDRT